MDKIHLLDKTTSEMISAGEVVERPASVVKELVENSIDAGASTITIEIKNGGISLIKISDNGIGMSFSDAKTSFLKHATSKISKKDDLFSIKTLGFRGEALCAIAVVSKIQLFTKEKQAVLGTIVKIEGGQLIQHEEAGTPEGTTIIVSNLFYNTPARLAFLKKDSSEASYISNIVEKLALSNPQISFRLINNGAEVFYTSGDGNLKNLIQSFYGSQYSNSALEIDYTEDDITVKGYTLKPTVNKNNKTMQNFFINNRYIKSNIISNALTAAYKNEIMIGKFPISFIYITINCTKIDVNVHPTKLEVKFTDDNKIFNVIYNSIIKALKQDTAREMFVEAKKADFPKPLSADIFNMFKEINKSSEQINLDLNNSNLKLHDTSVFKEPIVTKTVWDVQEKTNVEEIKINFPVQQTLEKEEKNFKIIGEAFNSYILVQEEESLLLIDKHAAHERIIFERLQKSYDDFLSQMLLAPIKIVLSKINCDIAIENKELLSKYGFNFDYFGGCDILIREVPHILSDYNMADVFEEVIENISNGNKNSKASLHEAILHTIACKAAIKAGSITSDVERERFIKEIFKLDNIKHCPHGRPVISEITKKQIEKMFKRI